MMSRSGDGDLALVMSGGGARAAYQVGFLRCLAEHHPDLHTPILTGISAGALNAAYLASHPGRFRDKVETMADIWSKLTADQVFRVDTLSIARNVARWGLRLLMGQASSHIRPRSLVNPAPLRTLMERVLDPPGGLLKGIQTNLDSGKLKALAITASSYSTGQSISWVQSNQYEPWERAHRKSMACEIRLDHILASASLPIFFPAVPIGGRWYGDGGIRMTAPLSPAVHLGASRILAISSRYGRSREELERSYINGYPPPIQVAGSLFDAIFLDVFDNDALRLERINCLLEHLPPEKCDGLRPIELMLLRPSLDLGKLANEYEAELPHAFRYMTRGLGTKETRSNDLLSLVMFQPDYLERLIDLGYADAEARKDEIARFLNPA
jgi:NTE family protein